MPYCPKCEAEYRPEIRICPECRVSLVPELAAEPVEMEELDVVCTVTQEANAYILRGFLENEGIPCVLENISFHATPSPTDDLVRLRLWSKKADVERARRLIREHEQFPTCPACHHVVLTQDTVCDFCGETLAGA